MSGINGIHHLCINTPDMDKSIHFYCELIGFTQIDRETCDFGEYAMLTLGGTRLELIQPKHPTADSFGNRGSLAHFGLGVTGIDEVVADLRKKGIQFLSDEINEDAAPMGGLRAISLLGPSDEAINLYEFKRAF